MHGLSVSFLNMSDQTPERAPLHVIRHPLQGYSESVLEQEMIVTALLNKQAKDTMIFTEHLPVYTLGTSAGSADVISREVDGEKIDVCKTGRGGEATYHGPGQLVCYVIVDISNEQDLHRHVWRLEEMIIRTLADFGIEAERNKRGIGVWVGGKKIAAVGVRCCKWVTFHGIALNINPNMRHFQGIITCGMADRPVVSMQGLGVDAEREAVEAKILVHADELFGASPDL